MSIFTFHKKKSSNRWLNRIKSTFKILIVLVIVIGTTYAYTSSSTTAVNDYDIKSYDVDMVVGEDNVIHITEKIHVYFNYARHGIYREIPTSGNIDRTNRSNGKFKAKVRNIRVSDNYTKSIGFSNNEGYVRLQIGDASRIIKGDKTYTISYDYKLYDDGEKEYDELYTNIIGTNWTATIENVTFKITMPKEFGVSELGFTHGRKGNTYTDNIEYNVEGNVITGAYNGTLNKYEGLTIRCELPQGYFVYTDEYANLKYGYYALCGLSVLILLVLWMKNGKDRPVVETVEFYPPEDLNSLELAYAYNVKAKGKDVTSLLIYLANKGYLEIEEKDGGIFGTKSFIIKKLKDYDGDNTFEDIFFNGLFKKKELVSEEDLRDSFYRTQNKILNKINTKKNKEKLIDRKSIISKRIAKLISFAILIITIVFAAVISEEMELLAFAFPFIFVFGIFYSIFSSFANDSGVEKTIKIFFTSFFGFPFAMAMMAFIVPVIMENDASISNIFIPVVVGIIAFIIDRILTGIMTARTEYGAQMLGKIGGFKRFLINARKEELERLVMENPKYFYDILPYTYVLGVSNKWISKFESINVESPTWYSGTTAFSVVSFSSSMDRTFRSVSSAMSSSPSSSGGSSGGFSGGSSGGSSGGGTGGGGGGSW